MMPEILALQRFTQFIAHICQQRFYDARVTGNDVTGRKITVAADKVSDQTASFTHQQFTCRKIPWLQANLKIAINAASGNVG